MPLSFYQKPIQTYRKTIKTYCNSIITMLYYTQQNKRHRCMPSERYGEHMKKETVVWITKYLLDFMYFAGIVATVTLPWSIKWIARVFQYEVFVEQYKESVLIYFILGILAILIIGELRKMFRTVLADDCFVRENVVSLQRMGTYSFIIAIICLLRAVLYLTVTMLTLVLVFVIAGLFSKVLAFVFDKAIDYKEENDLTV